MTGIRLLPAALLAIFGLHAAAHAQIVAAPVDAAKAAQDAQRIQQLEQQRQARDRDPPKPKDRPGLDPSSLSVPTGKVPDLGVACREMQSISINGAANLPQDVRQRLSAPYLQRCLSAREIEKLMADITAWYVGRGFITTRVYVPSQDLKAGKLELLVLEGVVEKIEIKDGDAHSVAVNAVFPKMAGQVLNLRDIEQGLDQINRLSSNDAKMEIVPGSEAGKSIVRINNSPKAWWRMHATYDNQGSESTGKRQLGLSLSTDNALGVNDFFSLTHRQSMPGERGRRFSVADNASFSVPYGAHSFLLGLGHSRYDSSVTTPTGRAFAINGSSDNASLRWDRVWYRNQNSRFSAGVGLSVKDSKNYLAGELLTVSSRKLSVLDVDANFTTGLADGVFAIDFGYARGLSAFGALRDPAAVPEGVARAQFGKIKYGLSYTRPFKVAGKDGAFSSTIAGQYGLDSLYASEQILIGGIYSVRGFTNTTFSGDRGFTWRNDVSLKFPFDALGKSGVIKPYAALDYGRVSNKSGLAAESAALTGAALGVSVNLGAASWEIFNSRPLSVPTGYAREASSTWFRLSVSM